MRRVKTAAAAIAVAATAIAASAQEVRRVAVDESSGYGITYALPKTEVRITVTATVTTVEAGPYAAYAERTLGIKDAPQENSTTWSVDDIRIEAGAATDSSRVYRISFDDKIPPVSFYLTPEGFIWSINDEPRKVESANDPSLATTTNDGDAPKPTLAPTNIYNEEILKAGSKARAAEVAARQVFRIRESRMDLLTGESDNLPRDGASYQLVLDNLQAQEDAYLALFTGTRQTQTVSRTFVVVPTTATDADVVFRFSRHFGIVDADDLSGEPYTLRIAITADNRQQAEAALPTAGKRSKHPDTGITYALPGKARVTVAHGTTTLAEADVDVAQFGRVEQLPASAFTDKKHPTSAQFNPLTGAIKVYEQQ